MVFTPNTAQQMGSRNSFRLEAGILLRSRQPTGSSPAFVAYSVPRAARKPITLTTVGEGGSMLSLSRIVFSLWNIGLPVGVAPKVGDEIQDATGIIYEVDPQAGINTRGLGTRYEVTCLPAV